MVMLAVRPAEPVPVLVEDLELIAAAEAAQVVLKRFLATGKAPLYLRQGVAALMAWSRL